jgi:hypothetical protein
MGGGGGDGLTYRAASEPTPLQDYPRASDCPHGLRFPAFGFRLGLWRFIAHCSFDFTAAVQRQPRRRLACPSRCGLIGLYRFAKKFHILPGGEHRMRQISTIGLPLPSHYACEYRKMVRSLWPWAFALRWKRNRQTRSHLRLILSTISHELDTADRIRPSCHEQYTLFIAYASWEASRKSADSSTSASHV